jgi:hypothetical protein
MLRRISTLTAAVAAVGLTAGAAQAATMQSELGILDTSGNNPATGSAWQAGDQYRLAFITSDSGTRDMTSYNISDYNDFVQTAANNGMSGLGDADWNALVSTLDNPETDGVDESMAARDNTNTNPDEDPTNQPIFLVDGSSVVFNNIEDMWDTGVQPTNDITLTENGSATGFGWPGTGTNSDGTIGSGLGGSSGLADQGRAGDHGTYQDWINSAFTDRSNTVDYYALSEPLTVVPEPASLALFGLGGLMLLPRRRRA